MVLVTATGTAAEKAVAATAAMVKRLVNCILTDGSREEYWCWRSEWILFEVKIEMLMMMVDTW